MRRLLPEYEWEAERAPEDPAAGEKRWPLALGEKVLDGRLLPIRGVFGDRDPLYPVSIALDLHRAIPRSYLWVVPNGAHGPIFGDAASRLFQYSFGVLGRIVVLADRVHREGVAVRT